MKHGMFFEFLLTFTLFSPKQTIAVDGCSGTYSTECVDWCNSKLTSGDDGPYQLYCEDPYPQIYWADGRCQGICAKKGCPDDCCVNRGNYIICPPQPTTTTPPPPEPEPSNSSGPPWGMILGGIASLLIIVGISCAALFCCRRNYYGPANFGSPVVAPYAGQSVSIYPTTSTIYQSPQMASTTPTPAQQEQGFDYRVDGTKA